MDAGLPNFMSQLSAFVQQHFEWMLGASLVLLIATLVLMPALIIRIPDDYFCYGKRHPLPGRHPLVKAVMSVLKNLLGALLVASGLIMLLTPGQGLITLLIGLMIMNYPGKYALERWLINRLHLLPALNWVRRRYHKAPLIPPSGRRDPPDTSA